MSGQNLRKSSKISKGAQIIQVAHDTKGATYYRNLQCGPLTGERARMVSALLRQARAQNDQAKRDALQKAAVRWKQKNRKTDPENPMVATLSHGRRYTPNETRVMELEAQKRAFAMRRELLEGALTTAQTAELLGTKRQTPHDRLKSGTLLALEDNGRWLFPYWQFDANGAKGIIEGLPETLHALNISAFAKANWLTLPNPYLEGRTPIQALKAGDVRRVVDIAQAVGAN